MRTLTLAQFAAEVGGTTDADVQGHIHAGLRSAPTTKTHAAFYARRLTALQTERDATREAYRKAVACGEIAEPVDTLERVADGHPDNQSVQAARRLLAKRHAAAEAKARG
jgi:hypothetical protein